jgi:hypothetical protein
MATRMQQRRGTEEQWTLANPVLAAGEIGFETDTNKFKIGDGVNNWGDLPYFVDADGLSGQLEGYVLESEKGEAFGVATLDEEGKVPVSQLPDIDEISQDAIDAALVGGTGITKTYNDEENTITLDVDTDVIATKEYVDTEISNIPEVDLTGYATEDYVDTAESDANSYADGAVSDHSDLTTGIHGVSGDVVGTSDAQTLTNKTMGNDLLMDGFQVSGLGTPTQADHAATKSYVDAVAEGLHVHASVAALADSNVSLPTAPATVDGVTLSLNDRVLLIGQTAPAENGIYVLINGDLARAADYNTAEEIQAGDFVFVSGGTVYGSTGWVQENAVATLGTDPIVWSQFSGAGTFSAGNGLNLDGNIFTIDDTITATRSYVDTQLLAKADTNSPTFTGLTDFEGIVDFSEAVVIGIDALPDQDGNSGKYLTTDGQVASWETVASPTPHPFSMIG